MNELFIEQFTIYFLGVMKLPAPGADDMRVGDGFVEALPRIAIRFAAAVQDQQVEMVRQDGIEAKARGGEDVQQQGEFSFGGERSHTSWWRKMDLDRFRGLFQARLRQPARKREHRQAAPRYTPRPQKASRRSSRGRAQNFP